MSANVLSILRGCLEMLDNLLLDLPRTLAGGGGGDVSLSVSDIFDNVDIDSELSMSDCGEATNTVFLMGICGGLTDTKSALVLRRPSDTWTFMGIFLG